MASTIDSSPRVIRRGDILWVDMDPVRGSEQGGTRPMIVLSPDFIVARSTVFLAAPLTSKKTERVYSFEALVEPPDGGITKRSKVMLLHTRAIDEDRVLGRLGSVGQETMREIENALKVASGLISLD